MALASGNSFTLDMYGDRLIQLAVGDEIAGKVIDVATGQPLKSLVSNDGTLRANGGRVELTAAAARHVVDSVINNRGVIEANSVGTRNGRIVLGGATADQPGLPKQTIKISGKITATGKDKGAKGGTIQITGEDIQFAAAMLDVSGHSGGGKILVGGDYGGGKPIPGGVNNPSAVLEGHAIPTATTVTVDGATTFNASATRERQRRQGDPVVGRADHLRRHDLSRAAASKAATAASSRCRASSSLRSPAWSTRARRTGATGTLLLDPTDFAIDSTPGPNTITPADLQNQLALANVVIATQATGTEPWRHLGSSQRDLVQQQHADAAGAPQYRVRRRGHQQHRRRKPDLARRQPRHRQRHGDLQRHSARSTSPAAAGKVSIFYNPIEGYSTPTRFHLGGARRKPRRLRQSAEPAVRLYAGEYLHRICRTWRTTCPAPTRSAGTLMPTICRRSEAPGSPFTGTLEGNGHTISNAIIAGTEQGNHYGLFASIGVGGVVRNLNLTGFQVSANSNPYLEASTQFIGTLAGSNAGTISNVTVTNSAVDGKKLTGVIAGGLVGQNGVFGEPNQPGTITNSSASATVTVGNGCAGDCYGGMNLAGGLVGANVAGSTITLSSAAGSVTGGTYSFIGGLVGQNDGSDHRLVRLRHRQFDGDRRTVQQRRRRARRL